MTNETDLFENGKLYQSPKDRYLQKFGDQDQPPSRRRGGIISHLCVLAIGFILGYLFYFIRLRGLI